MPPASHFRNVFALGFVIFTFRCSSSSPEETFAEDAAFLALLETPFLFFGLGDNEGLRSGVAGLELSGVGIGVTSVDGSLLWNVCCDSKEKQVNSTGARFTFPHNVIIPEWSPGRSGSLSLLLSELDGGVNLVTSKRGVLRALWSPDRSSSFTCCSK